MGDEKRLGAEVRARRKALGVTLRETAHVLGVSPGYVSDIEHGRRAPSDLTLGALAGELRVDDATRQRWRALAGRLPRDLTAALIAHPERWDDVRALLAKGGSDV